MQMAFVLRFGDRCREAGGGRSQRSYCNGWETDVTPSGSNAAAVCREKVVFFIA